MSGNTTDKTDSYVIPSLDRALRIIRLLADSPEGLTQRELASQLKYPLNSVFRILRTLEIHGLAHKKNGSSRFDLTPEMCVLGSKVANRFDLMTVATPVMTELAQRTRETVQISTYHRGKALLLSQIETAEPIKIAGEVGFLYDLHSTAPGKALMAFLPDDAFQSVLDTYGLVQRTANTISSVHALRVETEKVRATGWATDDQEYAVGIKCVSAPIFDYRGSVIAAVTITGPVSRMDQDAMNYLAEVVVEGAQRISRDLGYRAPMASTA